MKPQTTRSKVKVLNKPQHTQPADGRKNEKADEPSEVTCPIMRETL